MLIVIGQVSTLIRITLSIMEDFDSLKSLSGARLLVSYLEVALSIAVLVLASVTTIALFRKLSIFPSLWKLQYSVVVLFPFIEAALIARGLGVSVESLIDAETVGSSIGKAIGVALWWWYMNVSVRVRNTFVN